MPTSLTITGRLISMADLAVTENPNGETFEAEVAGYGMATLDKIPAVLFTQFEQFSTDALARAGGIDQGMLYYNTTGSGLCSLATPKRETPGGSVNGANLAFTVSESPQELLFIRNGLILKEGAGNAYTLSAQTMTMLGGSGTCNTSGNILTRLTGTEFKPSWDGMSIVINSVTYRIVKVLDSSTAFLSLTPGTQTGVAWSCSGAPVAGDKLEVIYWPV